MNHVVSKKKKFFTYDIMIGDRFICTMRFPMERAYKAIVNGSVETVVDGGDLLSFTYEKRPDLMKKDFRIEF